MRTISKQMMAVAACAAFAGCNGGMSTTPRAEDMTASTQQDPRACHGWKVVKSANRSSVNNQLYAVSGNLGKTLWTVGAYQKRSFSAFRTLTERWNGKSWSTVPSPNTGSGDNHLTGVAVISKSDVWAVGDSNATRTSTPKPLTEHWDGSRWRIVPSPSAGQLSGLGKVAAASTNDVWAVGAYYNYAGNQQTLVEHWNGSKWSIVASPSPGVSYNSLGGLAIVSPTNIWAAGSWSSDQGNTSQTLIEQWDGAQWSVVSSPNVYGSVYNDLGGIVAVSANDVWTVGGYESAPSFALRTLVAHWDGANWEIVPSANVGSGGNILGGIAQGAGLDLWAVGSYFDLASDVDRTLVERWDGQTWRTEKSPNPGSTYDELHAITSNTAGLWAVGTQGSGSQAGTLVEFHC